MPDTTWCPKRSRQSGLPSWGRRYVKLRSKFVIGVGERTKEWANQNTAVIVSPKTEDVRPHNVPLPRLMEKSTEAQGA